jgi:retron-type reverse transcriptase
MSPNIDEKMQEFFQPERIRETFNRYKETKRDYFDEEVIRVPMGADGISYETFDKELDLRCRFISTKVLKDTYQFYPFRQINIPKDNGGERVLSIATIRDVLVQKILYEVLYNEVENQFRKLDHVSYAYRKGKSAPLAARKVHKYIKEGYSFILDADIESFFDRIPHDDLSLLIDKNFGQNNLATNLLKRFIKTIGIPCKYEKNGTVKSLKIFHHYKPNREEIKEKLKKDLEKDQDIPRGIPQGGVLSGMLANLYLHGFDNWVVKKLSRDMDLQYVRYADDFVILFKQEENVEIAYRKVKEKLQSLKLEIHPLHEGKTRSINIEKQRLTFLGFEFDQDHIRISNKKNIEKFKNKILTKIQEEPAYNYKSWVSSEWRFRFFIGNVINRKIMGRGQETCPDCGGVIKAHSWIEFFSGAVTDTKQLHDLDKWIRQEIKKHFYKTYELKLRRADFRKAELESLEQTYYKYHRLRDDLKKQKIKCCDCNSEKSITNPTDSEEFDSSESDFLIRDSASHNVGDNNHEL